MEELLGNIDTADLQTQLLSQPGMKQAVEQVLKNPEALNEFKNFFTGGSKWRKKHTRNRKKRGSGGTHSSTKKHQKDYAKRVDKSFKNFPFATSSTTSEQDESEHVYPLKPMSMYGEKKRRGAVDWDSVFEDKMVNRPPNRKVYDESEHVYPLKPMSIYGEKIHRLRKEAQDIKKALQKKEEKDIKEGKKVMFGGKWSLKYKRSINCRKPKGFSQKQYCKRKNRKSKKKRKKSRKKRKRRKKKRTRRKRR